MHALPRLFPILVALFLAAPAFADAPDAKTKPPSRYFDSDGVKIHYVEKGEGDPVILLHGFTGTWMRQWGSTGLFDDLAETYRVIAIDNRGHGASDKPHDPKAYGDELVDDVIRLMDHLEIDEARFAGYSMGAFILMRLLTEHPDRVVCAVPGGAGWLKPDDPRSDIGLGVAEALESDRSFGPLVTALTPVGAEPPSPEQAKSISAMLIATNDVKALAACMRGMGELKVDAADLKENDVPVLMIVGDKDGLSESVKAAEGVMANLETHYIAEGNHMTTFRTPEYKQLLMEFFANADAPVAAAAAP